MSGAIKGGLFGATLRRILPQLIILGVVLMLNFAVFPGFFHVEFQNGRLFGNLIDVLNRGAPVALLAIGMTLVIATKGIDLSVGAVMAIAGAVAASVVTGGGGWVTALRGAGRRARGGAVERDAGGLLPGAADRRHAGAHGRGPGRGAAHHRGQDHDLSQ
ncbi:MAG: hypothetical protein R3D80_09045 [Paracoccaceae bacterium]